MSDRSVVERYTRAVAERDIEAAVALLHPDIVSRFPQSGETIRGRDNYAAILAAYPSLPEADLSAISGEADAVTVSTPLPFALPVISVIGSGDTFVAEGIARYGDGSTYHLIAVFKVRDGLIAEETLYWAEPFDPPEWRREFVEIDDS